MAKKKRLGRRKKARSYISNPAPRKSTRTIHHVAHRMSQKARAAGRVLRSYRRNPSSNVMDLAMLGSGALGGAILVPKAVSMIPVGSNFVKNLAMVLGGGALTYFSFKKKSYLGLGVGLGTAVAGGSRIVMNAVPALAGAGEYSQDEQHSISADLMGDDGESYDYMSAPAVMGADPFTNTMF